MLIKVEWHPTDRQVRVFGISGLLASLVAALVLLFLWGVALLWAAMVLAAGLVIFLCSRVSPRVARILFIGLALVGLPIGFGVSFLLLAAFYFFLLTPLALIFRLIGRDPLHRSWPRRPALPPPDHSATAPPGDGTSYWVPHRPSEDPERYFHQF